MAATAYVDDVDHDDARATADFDAVVIGAGHNGLITAAYLARAGRRTLLVEARDRVGGTAGSDPFGGGSVNTCNCDHLTFRTTPVRDELRLADFGLRYVDLTPSSAARSWSGGPSWRAHHDVEATIDELARVHPGEVDGYRRYLKAALPAARLVLEAANEPPSFAGLTPIGLRRRLAGAPTIFRWGRRSAADVIRSYFRHDALLGPAMVNGPMVWGITPETAGTGLGALGYALRHVGTVGRPIGGSGALTDAIRAAFEHHGGTVRLGTKVIAVRCHADRVRGVTLDDGTEIDAPVVVSAADPRRTFVDWLDHAPSGARSMVERWRVTTPGDGYESKIDAILDAVPRLRDDDHDLGATLTVAPSLREMDLAARLLPSGGIIDRPALLINVPSVVDPSVAPPGRHVFSLEVLLTPFRHDWSNTTEPDRWLDLVAGLCEPGFRESIVAHRVMTPDVYERDFHLPNGHATSFGGGPLAAFRSKDPELTRYQTAIPGLYLTGAATFPGAGVWGASGRNAATVILGRAAAAAAANR